MTGRTTVPVFAGILMAGVMASCSPSTAPGGSGVTVAGANEVAEEAIRADDMYARIAFLSSDSMAGRDTPSPGLEAAAAYLAGEYLEMGLEPAGESRTYYQRYPYTPRRTNLLRLPGAEPEQSFPPNVIAMLPGSDPALRNEYVVLSAHFDHVGIGAAVNGDSIYNGADDNGTGTSALLEIAEAFSSLPEAPRRSIVFLHVSGEEKGLLGSEWFSDNPTLPLEQIVADINVDMIGRNAPDTIVMIGRSYSDLGATVDRVAAAHPGLGLSVADDPWPEERFFFRSDHYNFARKEIPAIFFFAGVHEDYHRPSDTVEKIDTDKATRVARLIFFSALEIANAPDRPMWTRDGLAEIRRLTR